MNRQMKQAKYVAFSTQKGGAGKTTMTVIVASYLQYVKGYNVAIIDCDHPQYSISGIRKRDAEATVKDEYFKKMAYEQIKRLKKKPYPVTKSKPEDALEVAENMKKKNPDLDFIFFDLPGTANNNDVIHLVSHIEHIITPIVADRVDVVSSLMYAKTINETYVSIGKGKIKSIHMVWNKVDGREKTELYEVYEKVCGENGLPILKTFLPDSKRFRKETTMGRKAVFRSTVFPADKSLVRGSNLDKLVDEVLEIIKT